MVGYSLRAAPAKRFINGSILTSESSTSKGRNTHYTPNSSVDDQPVASPSRCPAQNTPASPRDAESHLDSFNSFRSRTNSVYSLSRTSLSSQLSQLTSLALPNATSLSTIISSIPTAPIAATTLGTTAEQIRSWLQKATEVLSALDAEDDVEWAAAGGRDGLGEVDTATRKFESLIGVYVTAIENLHKRGDILSVPAEQLKCLLDQMEKILKDWDNVRRSLKGIKAQVELAMEWEELWNVVLGDIGLEMENLSRLVFEMEEARHKALLADPLLESTTGLDMQELDTIVEESEKESTNHRISLSTAMPAGSPLNSPGLGIAQDDTRLLALFARMQPLRASLDFLPMTLSNFQTRAEGLLPSACQELESRRKSLEKKWKTLESDADGLRKELGEDRWVLVFRNAGRQAQKMCESVERAITKLQESVDVGTQHSNPPLLAKKMEAYEAKKDHYGPAIEKVLAIIEKGVSDRLTVNGEILRLRTDSKARWQSIKADIKDMDLALEDLAMNKNQQLRDSVSSIMSIDRSATASAVDTPGSSPASSVLMGPTDGNKRDLSPGMSPGLIGSSRRSSIVSGSTTRPNSSRRVFTMPPSSAGSAQIPRKMRVSRSFSSDGWPSSRGASPSPYMSSTPTPGSRTHRPAMPQVDNKPRWNSSPKVDYFEFGQKPRPLPYATPQLGRRSSLAFGSPSSVGSYSTSGLPLPSPLGRSSPVASPPAVTVAHRPRLASGSRTSMGIRQTSLSSPSAKSSDWVKIKDKPSPSPISSKRQSIRLGSTSSTPTETPPVEESPSVRERPQRPSTSMASGRRISMLPIPKNWSPLSNGRNTSLGSRPTSNG